MALVETQMLLVLKMRNFLTEVKSVLCSGGT